MLRGAYGRITGSYAVVAWVLSTFGTGASVLAVATHAAFLPYLSAALYALLIVAWLTDATKTTRGTLNGRLFLLAPASAPSNS